MTLSRQLTLLITALLLLAFAGTFLISVQNARDYLQKQLHTHAEDAATYLGLSISSQLAAGDQAMVTSMTDALFDRGYYRSIRIENLRGEVLVERILPLKSGGVPAWFIDHFSLAAPSGEAVVMAGWVQQGRVIVRSHPGYAYGQLWATVVETLQWFLLTALIALSVGALLLRQVLRPLKQVESQANAICEREFPALAPLPRIRDMRRIVKAMNRMSGRVEQMLDELERLASGLRAQAYQHPVTGLPNRRYFNDLLEDQVSSAEEFSRGALMLIELKEFKQYNEIHGYQAGDELLREAGSRLLQLEASWPRSQVAHLSGAYFAILIRECDEAQAERLAGQLSALLSGLYGSGLLDLPDAGHIGVAYYDGRQGASDLLSEADTALRMAQSRGANCWHMRGNTQPQTDPVRGAAGWRDFIQRALALRQIRLLFQPVVSTLDRHLLHQEVLVRLPQTLQDPEGAALMPAALFMPQAESLGLSEMIDKAVIRLLLEQLQETTDQETRYAINLSPHSLSADGFLDWLEQTLVAHRSEAQRFIFELPEYAVLSNIEAVRDLVERVSRFSAQVSIDHFGRSFGSLSYLRSLKVHCLKIDGSFMRSIEQSRDNQFFVQALAEIAHGLGLEVIAEAIESESAWRLLPELHVDGGQGFYIGRAE